MAGPLGVEEARALAAARLQGSPRLAHSQFVGHAMARLAEHLGEDRALWEVVGLCHDLDYLETASERSRHGQLAAEWLSDRLPEEALAAIAAHDHRTGVASRTLLADALKLCDVLAVMRESLADAAPLLAAPDAPRLIEERFADRPYLPAMLLRIAAEHGIPLSLLAAIARAGPPPT